MAARSPEEVDGLFQQYMRKGDLDSLLELYEPDIAFCNAEGKVKRGREALREELAPFAEAKAHFEFDIRKVIRGDDVVLVHNEWKVKGPREASGHAIEVMRRQPDGSWRFAIGDPFTLGKK